MADQNERRQSGREMIRDRYGREGGGEYERTTKGDMRERVIHRVHTSSNIPRLNQSLLCVWFW